MTTGTLSLDLPRSHYRDPKNLPGFGTFYSVKVCYVGDDAEFLLALGHHEPRRVIAAFNKAARHCGFEDIYDGQRKPGVVVADELERRWAWVYWDVPHADPEDWLIRWDAPQHDYYSFPVTVWRA